MLTSKTLKTSLVALVALAAVVPSAAGHGGGVSEYRSAVTSVSPATPGLTAEIVQGDQLALTNKTGKVVVVLGYAREPYLRFRAGGGVDLNVRSPAAALDLATNADAKAAPRWLRIHTGSSHAWHDNRIRWTGAVAPAVVRTERGSRHHIFNWSVPLLVEDRQASVRGTLDYVPAERTSAWWLSVPVGAALGATALFAFTSPRFTSRGRRSGRAQPR
jgi:hypothetical protein